MAATSYGNIIEAICEPIVGVGRCYEDTTPDGIDTTRAFVIYQDVGGVPAYLTEGAIGSKRNARIQVFLWAPTRGQRFGMMNIILHKVAEHPETEPLTETVSEYDQARKIFGSRLDVSVWTEPPAVQ